MTSRFIRAAALAASGAIATSLVAFASPAAFAAPAFVDAETVLDPYSNYSTGTGDCTNTPNPSVDPAVNPAIVENGAPTSVSSSATGSSVNDVDATDTITGSASATTTASVKSVGGVVSQIDLDTTGTYSYTASKPASACQANAYAGAYAEFRFTLTQPLFMHLDFASSPGSYSEVYVYTVSAAGSEPYYDHYGRGLKFAGQDTVYLPAGTYDGYFQGAVDKYSYTSGSGTATTSAHATFTSPGSQTEAVDGKGKKYTTLPASRSCATNSLVATVTGKKKRAGQIKSITYFVNEAKVAKIKGKKVKKGASVTIPVAAEVAADLTAEVSVKPKKKGQKAKSYEVSASYEACS